MTDTPPKPKRRRWRWVVAVVVMVIAVLWWWRTNSYSRFVGRWRLNGEVMIIRPDGLVQNFVPKSNRSWIDPQMLSRFRVQGTHVDVFTEVPTGLGAIINDIVEKFSAGNVRPFYSGTILRIDQNILRVVGPDGIETTYERVQ